MGLLRVLVARLRALVRRDVIAGEIRDELQFHVDMRTDEYERAGDSRDQAARRARRRVGNIAVAQDRGYDIRGGGVMETVLQDVRYGLRLLWKQRGFSTVAVMTLALGVGLSTALTSVIDAAVLHPLPYPHPEQLVDVTLQIVRRGGRGGRIGPSVADMRTMAASHLFTDVAMWRQISTPLVADGPTPEPLRGYEVTEQYFRLHGVAPLVGRGIEAADRVPGAAPVVVLGFDYWQRRYAGSSDAIGRTIRFDTGSATIVGALPAAFYRRTPLFRPLALMPAWEARRGTGSVTYARLRAGVPFDQAQRELTELIGREPGTPPVQSAVIRSLLDRTTSDYRTTVNILVGAVGLILLLVCVNVAGLLLARGTTRLPELAVRASMGAGRVRLIRQLVTESLVLSLVGGAAGVLLAWWSLDVLVANLPMRLPTEVPAAINWRVLGWSAALSMATGLLFGLAPAIRLSRVRIAGALGDGTRRLGSALSRRGGRLLIAAEIALAVVLLAAAGLMLRSFDRLISVDLGFDPDSIVTLEAQTVDATPSTIGQYFPTLVEAIRRLPGVAAVGATDDLPLGGSFSVMMAGIDGGATKGVQIQQVLPGYFEALGLPLLAGRFPTEFDRTAGHSIVIDELAAKQLFPGTSPLGHRLTMGSGPDYEVIGVVADVRFHGPSSSREPSPAIYRVARSDDEQPPRRFVVVVRPSGNGRGLPDLLRQTAQGIGPRVIVDRVRAGGAWLDDTILTDRRRTVLLGLLGSVGLLLALVGVFGMSAYAVARRTQEIGVRMAFGARPADVVWRMVRDASVPVAAGLVVGLGAATVATRVIASFLFQTAPTDPVTLVATALTLGVTATLAAWIPARRAAHIDPVRALRVE